MRILVSKGINVWTWTYGGHLRRNISTTVKDASTKIPLRCLPLALPFTIRKMMITRNETCGSLLVCQWDKFNIVIFSFCSPPYLMVSSALETLLKDWSCGGHQTLPNRSGRDTRIHISDHVSSMEFWECSNSLITRRCLIQINSGIVYHRFIFSHLNRSQIKSCDVFFFIFQEVSLATCR